MMLGINLVVSVLIRFLIKRLKNLATKKKNKVSAKHFISIKV